MAVIEHVIALIKFHCCSWEDGVEIAMPANVDLYSRLINELVIHHIKHHPTDLMPDGCHRIIDYIY
jgi:hypothetical protein